MSDAVQRFRAKLAELQASSNAFDTERISGELRDLSVEVASEHERLAGAFASRLPEDFPRDADTPAAVVDTLKEMDRNRERVMAMAVAAHEMQQAVAELYHEHDLKIDVHLGYQASSMQGVVVSFGSWGKEARDVRVVAPLLRRLRQLGYRRTSVDDYVEMARRTWHYEFKRYERTDNVHVSVFLSTDLTATDDTVCRFVKVGVKEEPVYELRCGGQNVTHEQLEGVEP